MPFIPLSEWPFYYFIPILFITVETNKKKSRTDSRVQIEYYTELFSQFK